MIPGVDMARVRREVAGIDARAIEVGQAIARERGQLASADLAAEVKRMWAKAKADNREEAGWPEFWEPLGLERHRENVRSTARATVHSAPKYPRVPSRDVERTAIERLT
jgi:hypothetical protein